MKDPRRITLVIIVILGILVVLASLLSLAHDLSFWYSKVLDFPRSQYLIASLILLLVFVVLNKRWGAAPIILCIGLAGSIAIQSTRVLPYLIGERAVPDADPLAIAPDNTVGIMIANVLINNRRSDEFLRSVKETDPDMLLIMEVDQWWLNELEPPARKKYPHAMAYPMENAYGMVLYSKFPLQDEEIMFLADEKVPSVHAKVVLPSGRLFRFHGVHPVAPVPSDKYPDSVGEEEVSLRKVGRMVAAEQLPSVVAGDLNDVSWSYTARLFSEEGDLRNVRLGRGLYNSFDARSWIMRWPLDHYFVTHEFSVMELKRLPAFGSDHFPMFVKLVLEGR